MGNRRSFKRAVNRVVRKLQGKKGKLRLVIVLGGIMCLILSATLITGVFYKPLSDYYVPSREIAEWDLPAPVPADVDITDSTENPDTPEAYEVPEPKPSDEQEPSAGTKPQQAADEKSKSDKDPSASQTPGLSVSNEVPGQSSENDGNHIVPDFEFVENIDELWLENKIKKYESEIDPVDLEDFRVILAKLDQALIKGLAAGGFTNEEAAKLIKHMKQNLTDKEYVRSKELFKRYNYLLEDV